MNSSLRVSTLPRSSRWFHVSTRTVIGVAQMLLLLLVSASCIADDGKGKPVISTCGFSDTGFDTAIDTQALTRYNDAIAELLKQEKFSELDCVADAARKTKATFSGGTWKLRNIYLGLEKPRPGHPTQVDWQKHFKLIEHWTRRNPQSITARIALAESYLNFAWDARGDGYSDSVSDSGWKLFGERTEKAKQILDSASALPSKCPEWFLAMQRVGRSLGWDLPRLTTLYQQAAAFEPEYYYYYRFYAVDLEPKWSGNEGDAARFADDVANKFSGDAADIVYFRIATGIVCACENGEFSHFSWPRLQKGFSALEKNYGPDLFSLNYFTLMAVQSRDWIVADPGFKRLGDNWNKEVWRSEEWYNSNRDLAAQIAPSQERTRAYRREAEENMKTQEGQAYAEKLLPKLRNFEEPCLKEPNTDLSKFELIIQVGKDGAAQQWFTENSPKPFSLCVMKELYQSYLKKETPFPVPPKDSYRVILDVDPATLSAAAK